VPRRSRLVPLAATLLAALTAAGCGSGGSADVSVNPSSAIAEAADTTAKVPGMKLSIDETVGGTQVTGHGFSDTKGKRGKFVMETGGQSIVMVSDGFILYMQPPASLGGKLPNGAHWMKLDLAKAAKTQGIDLNALAGVGGGQQQNTFDQLRAAGDVKQVGTEPVRGASTTHYSAVIDLDKVAASAPADRRAAVQSSIAKLEEQLPAGDHTIPVEVWIDGQKRVRRIKEHLALKTGTMDMTEELYDFGAQDSVPIPAGDDVYDATDAATSAAGTATTKG
jgi:hypothetical protein